MVLLTPFASFYASTINSVSLHSSADNLSFCCHQNAPRKCSPAPCSPCSACLDGTFPLLQLMSPSLLCISLGSTLQCSLAPSTPPSSTSPSPSHRTALSRLFVSLSLLVLFAAALGVAFLAWRQQRVRILPPSLCDLSYLRSRQEQAWCDLFLSNQPYKGQDGCLANAEAQISHPIHDNPSTLMTYFLDLLDDSFF